MDKIEYGRFKHLYYSEMIIEILEPTIFHLLQDDHIHLLLMVQRYIVLEHCDSVAQTP